LGKRQGLPQKTMPNKERSEETTLQTIRSFDHDTLVTWLFKAVMPRLRKADYLHEHLPAGFQHATQSPKLTAALAGATSVSGIVRWVQIATRNKAADLLRKEKRKSEKTLPFNEDVALPEAAPAHEIIDPVDALTPELKEKIFSRLTPTEHKLFELYLRKMKPRDIAVALAWKPGTVWTRRAELKKKIMDILRKKNEGECSE